MAEITSYPTASPKGGDYLLGAQVGVPGDTIANPTKKFTVASINALQSSGGVDLIQKDIVITPAQLLNFNGGGSIELIPAPGTGKLIAVQNMIYFLDYNSVAYNFATPGFSDTITFKIGTINTFQFLNTTNDLNVSADKYISFDFPNDDENDDIQANVAFTLDATAGVTVSQGNSPVKLSILYRNVNLNF
jgi:hypothetical protein